METTELLLFAIAIMNIFLALMVIFGNRKDKINIWLGVFALSIAAWALSLVVFRSANDMDIAKTALIVSYGAAVVIAFSFYVFMHYFPTEERISLFERAIFGLSLLCVSSALFIPNFFIVDVIVRDGVRVGVQGIWGFWVFAVYFISYFFGALFVLFKRWKVADFPLKRNIGFIIWSVLTAGILGVLFNLVFPSPFFAEWRFTWLGPIFTAIIVATLSYAIARHRLLNVRVIAAEMLSVAIIFILFMEALFAKTQEEQMLRLSFFVVAAFFSSFLVRSVRKEVKQKEELERVTKDLEFANTELKKLDQAKSEFISIASHQLRAPITAIKGYVSMIMEGSFGDVPQKAMEPLRRTFVSSEELVSLVADLLNLSRIESGKMKYDFKVIDLPILISKAIKELEEVAKKEETVVQFDEKFFGDTKVNGDQIKLYEVFMNLLDNAIKYSPKGVIKIGSRGQGLGASKKIVVFVSDNGIGIKKEEINKLFSKFGRTEMSQKIRPDGMGIGLYFARRVVEDHKGKIWVESEGEGKGSTFFIQLPVI